MALQVRRFLYSKMYSKMAVRKVRYNDIKGYKGDKAIIMITDGKELFTRVMLMSGRQDLNLRPLDPQPSALPDCATPRIMN